MDEYLEFFLEEFGGISNKLPATDSALEQYRGVLPDQLLSYWSEVGWSSFGQGLYWLVNPQDWHEPMVHMLQETEFLKADNYHMIARNAFGDLWLWGEKSGGSLSIRSSDGMIFPMAPHDGFGDKGMDFEMQIFFSSTDPEEVDLLGNDEKPLFERALQKLGPLVAHEVYGFAPLPALGGAGDLASLQKLEAATYMDLLAEVTPMRVMPDYAAIAKDQGLL